MSNGWMSVANLYIYTGMLKRALPFFGLLFLASGALPEDKDPLIIKHADSFEYLDKNGVKTQKLVGHVEIHYKDAKIKSDTAVHYYTLEKLEFIRRVRLDYDGQSIFTDRLVYYKKDTMGDARGDVVLVGFAERGG